MHPEAVEIGDVELVRRDAPGFVPGHPKEVQSLGPGRPIATGFPLPDLHPPFQLAGGIVDLPQIHSIRQVQFPEEPDGVVMPGHDPAYGSVILRKRDRVSCRLRVASALDEGLREEVPLVLGDGSGPGERGE